MTIDETDHTLRGCDPSIVHVHSIQCTVHWNYTRQMTISRVPSSSRLIVLALFSVTLCIATLNFAVLLEFHMAEDIGQSPNDFSMELTNGIDSDQSPLRQESIIASRVDETSHRPLCKNQLESDESSSSPTYSYLSQIDAQKIVKDYVEERTDQSSRPRFVPVLNTLMKAASARGVSLMTFQLGGMDGKTGDPMYRMTEFQENLESWEPIVVEPVPDNFQKLVGTYRVHQEEKGLKCPRLLHQIISYDNHDDHNRCHFCHFDPNKTDAEECRDLPEYLKKETGSMDCGKQNNFKAQCFVKETYTCGTITEALRSEGLSSEHMVVLQIDVEGFEEQMINGYLDEIPPEHYPAVINFESRVIKRRGQLDTIFKNLRDKGYGIHEKRVDTLALLGAQGLLLDNL